MLDTEWTEGVVYQIVNTVTNERYIGSSKDVKHRWKQHKYPSTWNQKPNKRLYQDMQKYDVENFRFQILAPVEPKYLTQVEQEFIEMLEPVYNDRLANGWDVERIKETHRKAIRKYEQSDKGKEVRKNYYNQICYYNSETLTLCALAMRFSRAGVEHPTQEAKKYLLATNN